jgi:hydroxyacylglutathione hydrolase
MLDILQIPVLNDNYIYMLHDSVSLETAVIDPALEQPVLDVLAEKGWQLSFILNTHHHWDHVGANLALKQQTGCQIIAAAADRERIPGIDVGVEQGDVFALGQHQAQVIATPGHTSGHVVYYFAEDQALFCGDTLFVMGCGRLFEGTPEQMYASLQTLKALPPSTRVYCTHEYTLANATFALSVEPDNIDLQQKLLAVKELRAANIATVPTTIAEEIATNPFFRVENINIQKELGLVGAAADVVFAALRQRKDNF